MVLFFRASAETSEVSRRRQWETKKFRAAQQSALRNRGGRFALGVEEAFDQWQLTSQQFMQSFWRVPSAQQNCHAGRPGGYTGSSLGRAAVHRVVRDAGGQLAFRLAADCRGKDL